MLSTCACSHRSPTVGMLKKRPYLFVLVSGIIVCLLCYLKDSESASNTTWPLEGEVVETQSSTRLNGVTVRIKGLERRVRTDANGRFKFDAVSEGQQTLQFLKVGYQRVEQVIDVNAATPYLKIELETLSFQLQTIRVYGSNRALSQFEETTDLALDEEELQRRLGMTLANTLADETGISQRMMGRAIARPVIRGLGGDRLLILENGERTGDKSASSADHAVSIDPTTAEGVEITRGPASLIYGSSTLGGVINVKSNHIPQILPRRLDMHLTFQGESVNSGLTGTTGFTFPMGDFAGNVEWNRRLASDIQTPVGVLENTALSNVNFSGGASLIKPWGFIGASGSSYRSDYGVPGSPEGHISGVNIELDKQRYEGQMEYRFNRAMLEKIRLQTAYTRYQHQEWESNGRLGVEFGLLTYNVSAMAHLLDNAIAGVSWEYRDHATDGFYWTPHTRELALASFYLNQRNFDKLTLQGAIRYDLRRSEPFRPGAVVRAGTVQRRDFNGFSGAASGIYHWTDRLSTGATLMKTFRAPGIEELFSDGPHLAVYSYEIGNAELGPENGYGTELFVKYAVDRFRLNLALFRNQIQNYLVPTNSGEKEWGSGAAGWLWIYQYMGHDVVMDGAEIQIGGEVLPQVHLQLNMSYVNGTIQTNGRPLERVPPLNGKFVISYTPTPLHLYVASRFSGSQTRLGQFEEPTDGYLVYDIGSYLNFSWWQIENMVVFEIENLFDTTYREHLSRIKSAMPEPGRNVKLLYKLNF
ncbi:TonB-dependent receptor [Candidatus Poribacteria bacterium]|nr:TonB-dependent receptor [Candidatus Poribacteria bacterium]MYK96521.1 TonB-dependent receptor [Candidatus Poribacteria bacterium]